jgi:hypothetical protein
VSRNSVGEVRDDSKAILDIGSFVRGCVIGRGGVRKSRGGVGT